MISPEWYGKAAFDIARNNYTLFRWVNENNKGLTKLECERVAKSPEFQQVLRTERYKLYKELAKDAGHSRTVAVGQLLFIVEKLIEAGSFDKAAASLAQLFKVEGWSVEQAGQVNIFQDLGARDIAALRAKLKGESKPADA